MSVILELGHISSFQYGQEGSSAILFSLSQDPVKGWDIQNGEQHQPLLPPYPQNISSSSKTIIYSHSVFPSL